MSTGRRSGRYVFALIGVVALLAVACGGGDGDGGNGDAVREDPVAAFDADAWTAEALSVAPDAPFAPVIVNSNVGVGPNRLVFALLDAAGIPVTDAEVSMRLFSLDTAPNSNVVTGGVLRAETALAERSIEPGVDHRHADGAIHRHSAGRTSVYVATLVVDREGWWGAELDIRTPADDLTGMRLRFFVLPRSRDPGLGDAAPRSTQPVLRDVAGITEIDTAIPPNPTFHQLTVAEAIDTGNPVVVVFATPAFCQTRFCGPVLAEAVAPMAAQFPGQIEIVHIEPFDLAVISAGNLVGVPEMEEWGLVTEPWVFVLDRSGRVVAKFEGIVEAEEIANVLAALIEGGA